MWAWNYLNFTCHCFPCFAVSSITHSGSSTLDDNFASLFRRVLTSCSVIYLWWGIDGSHNRGHSWIICDKIEGKGRSSHFSSKRSCGGPPKEIFFLNRGNYILIITRRRKIGDIYEPIKSMSNVMEAGRVSKEEVLKEKYYS